MELKQIFIQLNEETNFNTIKIVRQLSIDEDRVERHRNGLIAAIKMQYGKDASPFLKELNALYQTSEIPLLSNSTVLLIFKKWVINKSIFDVIQFLVSELNDSKLIQNTELVDKAIHFIELQINSDLEHVKFKIWLTCKIILKVYTDGNYEKLGNFSQLIWRDQSVLNKMFVPDKFVPKFVDARFKPIWFAFSIFKKQKAKPEIYLTFFTDFFVKLFDPEVTEKGFLKFLQVIFEKNKIEVVYGFSFKDYMRLYEIKKVSEQLFNRFPDLSNTDIEYEFKDRTLNESHCFKLVYNVLTDYGISYFFITNFFHGQLKSQEKEWFYDVLQGNNLVYSKNLPFTLTKKVAHFFNATPDDWKNNSNEMKFDSPAHRYGIVDNNYSLTQSLIYCAIYFEVRSEEYAKEVLRNIRRSENFDFWITTLCKLYHKGLRVEDMNQVVDYIDDQVIRNGRQIDFNTKKLSNLLTEALIWHEEIQFLSVGKYKRTINLPKSEIEPFNTEYKDKKYKIVQLTTNKSLIEEGRNLFHCVGTYTDNCLDRGSYIFSLRLIQDQFEDKVLITIELNGNSIRQKRGKRNRSCSAEEDRIIRIWAKENNLKFI
jgi:hypothetical protein